MKLNKNPYNETALSLAWQNGYDQIDVILKSNELINVWKEGLKAKEEDLKKIPNGPYCYHGSAAPSDPNFCICPFWEKRTIESGEFKGEEYGYCSLIKLGDFATDPNQETTLLLHDQVKECGLNNDWDEEN